MTWCFPSVSQNVGWPRKVLFMVPGSEVQALPSASPDPYQRETRIHRDQMRMGLVLWAILLWASWAL